jgi:hypothetical protein
VDEEVPAVGKLLLPEDEEGPACSIGSFFFFGIVNFFGGGNGRGTSFTIRGAEDNFFFESLSDMMADTNSGRKSAM